MKVMKLIMDTDCLFTRIEKLSEKRCINVTPSEWNMVLAAK